MARPAPPDEGSRRAAWAHWLRERMDARGLSLRRLAKHCGVSMGAVQSWLAGSYPGLDVACRLADALGVTVEELCAEAQGVWIEV